MNKPTAKHYGIIGSDSVIRAYSADETDAYIAHLEQRAEAAESLAAETALKCVAYASANMENLSRAEAAEARLAELEKQEPIFQVEVSGNHWLNAGPVDDSDFTGLPDGVNLLYARPAPAINLAELVPGMIKLEPGSAPYVDEFLSAGWNACRAAILRNIEHK